MDRRRVSPIVGTTNGYCGAMIGKDDTCLDDEEDIRRWREGGGFVLQHLRRQTTVHHLPTTFNQNVSPEQPHFCLAHGKGFFDSS